LNGLMKKATGPICIAVARAARSSRAVMTITRVCGDSAHNRARTSSPVTFPSRCRVPRPKRGRRRHRRGNLPVC
jgi:hypothetical protein